MTMPCDHGHSVEYGLQSLSNFTNRFNNRLNIASKAFRGSQCRLYEPTYAIRQLLQAFPIRRGQVIPGHHNTICFQ